MKPISLILSCEHGGNEIPKAYEHLFADKKEILDTHRGLDIGALDIASTLKQELEVPGNFTTISRLLIDCNRSLTHTNCFSEFTRTLPEKEQQTIINQYYLPYRKKTEDLIESHIHQGHQVLHLSIHSFTPELNGRVRNAAIGLLYDSKRHAEKEVARIWHGLLLKQTPAYRIRMNYPYQGSSDGFTTHFRKRYDEKMYLGIEVESNQALVLEEFALNQLKKALSNSIKELLDLL